MTALRVRNPTGKVAWPLILVEGEENSGKSYAAYSLSADERVGRTFVIEFGEGIADEYAELGPYEIVDHNGTYTDLLAQLEAACAVATEPGVPNVVVIDQVTELWELLKNWAEHRARSSKSGRRRLTEDPDAEVDIPMNIWNDANGRWHRVLNVLRRSNVIGVLVARSKEVAKVRNGQPVSGESDYRIEAQKSTPFAVKAHVRMTKPHTATLIGVNSLKVDVPVNGRVLSDKNPLGELVFDVLGCGVDSVARPFTHGVVGVSLVDAKNRLFNYLKAEGIPEDDAKVIGLDLWRQHAAGVVEEIPADHLADIMDAAAEMVEQRTVPVDLSPKALAIRSGEVFAVAGETARKGQKTKTLDRLRHALVHAVSGGATTSLSDLDDDGKARFNDRLKDIESGSLTYEFSMADDGGVSFADESGGFSVLWSDIEPPADTAAPEPEEAA